MPEPVIVAAAGNLSRNELSFPARFAEVLAISSITSKREPSSFSNYGEKMIKWKKNMRTDLLRLVANRRGPTRNTLGDSRAAVKMFLVPLFR